MTRRHGGKLIVALLVLAGLLFAFQLRQVLTRPLTLTDLRYVWLAGKLWLAHANPYGPAFVADSIAAFGSENRLSFWVYPFQWYWIATPLAMMTPEAALHVWQAASHALVIFAAVLTIRAAGTLGAAPGAVAGLLLAIYATTFNPLAAMLQLGQPGLLSVIGFAALLFGTAMRRDAISVIGVVLLALKPQFGIPVLMMLALSPGGVRLCVIGGAITAALAVPPLLIGGVEDQVGGLIANITGGYDDVPINRPIAMVGLPHLLAAVAGIRMPISIGLLVAVVFVTVGGIALRRHRALRREDRLTYAAALPATAVSTLVGVHPYDLSVLLVTLPLLARQQRPFALVGLAGYLLLWRFENLARALRLDAEHGNIMLATVAVFMIAASWTLDLAWRLSRGSRS